MDRFDLQAGGAPVHLGTGYTLRTPGLNGTAEVFVPRRGEGVSRAAAPATPELEAAFANTDVEEAATIALDARSTGRPAAGVTLRSASGEEALELEVPDLGPERGQMVLAVDENGVVTWHFPVGEAGGGEAATTRGGGPTRRFLIPSEPVPPPASPATHRSFVGAVGRKLLKVLVYPITDDLLGAAGNAFAAKWEARHRPYRVRRFTADGYTAAAVPDLDSEGWATLSGRPALLFVHGTFSTSHGAFGDLSRELLAELERRYEGRVIAFDNHTLSQDPGGNAEKFLSLVPPGVDLDLDVVCHSRGGLVTRELAALGAAAGGRVAVRRGVFVGVPNAGTALADPDHMTHMIDRFTTAVALLPGGPVTEIMEGVITAVKVIGHGVVGGLPGLAAMRPGGDFLERLATADVPGEWYAITADYEPPADTLARLVRNVAVDLAVDRVFEKAPNDLVVPTTGVFDVADTPGFPIPEHRVHRFDASAGVTHTTYFAEPGTARALERWLRA